MTKTDVEPVRLNRFLAQVGIASRRACDELIEAGKVMVDGKRVRKPGVRVVPGVNVVTVNGQRVDSPRRPLVLLLHKPTGVVTTANDPQGRATVLDLVKKHARRRRLFPVGRLDVNTTGLLLLTNDGLLCYRLTHPKFGLARTYQVKARGGWNERTLARLRKMAAASVSDGEGADGSVRLIKQLGKSVVLQIKLHEGRNRQVRKMCEAVGLHVTKLKRVGFGPITLRGVPLGSVRPLEDAELARLRKATGFDD